MYPSVWTLPRKSMFEFRLRDHLFEAGTIFYTSQWVTHRDPRWFPEPERFLPERWLEASAPPPKREPASKGATTGNSTGRAIRHPFAFFPFGGGKRFCLGKAVFDFEAGLLLRSLFREWRLEPVETCRPRPRFYVTMQPDRSPLVVLRRRSSPGPGPTPGPKQSGPTQLAPPEFAPPANQRMHDRSSGTGFRRLLVPKAVSEAVQSSD